MAADGMVNAFHEFPKALVAGQSHLKIPWTVGKPLMKKQAKTDKSLQSDNGERRAGSERRRFSYTLYIPERRKGRDRRDGNGCMPLRPTTSPKTPSSRKEDEPDQTENPS
jgi:hypothetical protein